jgi:hypothetical protein
MKVEETKEGLRSFLLEVVMQGGNVQNEDPCSQVVVLNEEAQNVAVVVPNVVSKNVSNISPLCSIMLLFFSGGVVESKLKHLLVEGQQNVSLHNCKYQNTIRSL